MFKIYLLAPLCLLTCFSSTSSAQNNSRSSRLIKYANHADSIVRNYQDALADIKYNYVSANDAADISPYMYRIVEPNTFYSNALQSQFGIDWDSSYFTTKDDDYAYSDGMAYRTYLNDMIDRTLVNTYVNHPDNFRRYDDQFNSVELISDVNVDKLKTGEMEKIISSAPLLLENVSEVLDTAKVEIIVEKPNFWTKSGKFTTQFTQNYFSDNWYKGGNNNITLLSTILLEANYNDQNKIQWDNKIDLRLGFISTPSDTCHNFLTSNDKIYLYSKLGIKATKSWFYTLQGEVNTQFMPGYKSNDRKAYSKFLAPLDVYVSLGMDFKPTLKKGTLSVAFLPLSYKMRYIGSDDELQTIHKAYNQLWKDGTNRMTKHDFGSKVEVNAKFELVKNLTWRSRFYYYSTYKYAESEWENSFSFQFNKYISTEVNALWRFDDNRSVDYKDDKLGYFQFKEYFTLGLSYNF